LSNLRAFLNEASKAEPISVPWAEAKACAEESAAPTVLETVSASPES
jgi:hypothetical protein